MSAIVLRRRLHKPTLPGITLTFRIANSTRLNGHLYRAVMYIQRLASSYPVGSRRSR
jgi:hypothetical protein